MQRGRVSIGFWSGERKGSFLFVPILTPIHNKYGNFCISFQKSRVLPFDVLPEASRMQFWLRGCTYTAPQTTWMGCIGEPLAVGEERGKVREDCRVARGGRCGESAPSDFLPNLRLRDAINNNRPSFASLLFLSFLCSNIGRLVACTQD